MYVKKKNTIKTSRVSITQVLLSSALEGCEHWVSWLVAVKLGVIENIHPAARSRFGFYHMHGKTIKINIKRVPEQRPPWDAAVRVPCNGEDSPQVGQLHGRGWVDQEAQAKEREVSCQLGGAWAQREWFSHRCPQRVTAGACKWIQTQPPVTEGLGQSTSFLWPSALPNCCESWLG